MNWETLLSLKRFGDQENRKRIDQDESRLGFEVDFDRIIFSDSFRSLQDKTQVVPLSQTDFVHTRLTHSLEVSVVARSLGRIVGKYIIDKYPDLREKGYRPNDESFDWEEIENVISFVSQDMDWEKQGEFYGMTGEVGGRRIANFLQNALGYYNTEE